MKEITIVAPNKVGVLALISESLGSAGVNIEAISAYEKNDSAIFRVLTKDVSTALRELSKIPDLQTKEQDVLVIRLSNRPGELGKLTRKLANKNINLESLYIVTRKEEYTEVAIKPLEADFEKTKEMLNL